MWNVTLQSICLAIIIKKKPVWLNRNSQFVSPNVQLVPNVHVSQTLISRQVKKFWDKVWWLTLATWSWTILLFQQTWLWTLCNYTVFENRPKIMSVTCAIVHLHCMFDALLYINVLMWKPKIQSIYFMHIISIRNCINCCTICQPFQNMWFLITLGTKCTLGTSPHMICKLYYVKCLVTYYTTRTLITTWILTKILFG